MENGAVGESQVVCRHPDGVTNQRSAHVLGFDSR
jgi:hypothetical protein